MIVNNCRLCQNTGWYGHDDIQLPLVDVLNLARMSTSGVAANLICHCLAGDLIDARYGSYKVSGRRWSVA